MKKKSSINSTEDTSTPEPPDGGWGWFVVIGVHVAQALSLGILTSCGPIIVEWTKFFDTSLAVTSWVFSLTALMGAIVTPFAAGVASKFGSRPLVMCGGVVSFVAFFLSIFAKNIEQLFAYMGIIMGIALGLIYAPALLMIGVYFKKHYTLANGLAFLGICTGQLIFSPLFVYLNSEYGWRGAMLIFGAISCNCIACGALFRPLKKKQVYTEVDRGIEARGEDDANIEEDFRERQKTAKGFLTALRALGEAFAIPVCMSNYVFSIYLLCVFCLGTAYFIPLVHLANKVVGGGLTEEDGAWMISIMGAGSFVGRGGHGWFVDKKLISAQTFMIICILFSSVETLALVLTNLRIVLMILSFLFGVTTGVIVPLTFVIPRLLVKQKQIPSVIGLTLLINALGNATGPVLGGWLYDVTGDYLIPFIVATGIYALGALFFIPVAIFLCQERQYESVETNWSQMDPVHRTRNDVDHDVTPRREIITTV